MEWLGKCILCGELTSDCTKVFNMEEYGLVSCASCGLLFANPQYTNEELDKYYNELYLEDRIKGIEYSAHSRKNRILHETSIRHILNAFPELKKMKKTSLLDYGCGYGLFLDVAKSNGFSCVGIESAENAIRYGIGELGLDVRHYSELENSSIEDDSFDLITLWSVLEHLKDPVGTLRRLTSKLKRGGILALTIPNRNCYAAIIKGKEWTNYKNKGHLLFFSMNNMRHVLNNLGYMEVRRVKMFGGRAGFNVAANVVQYLARCLNLGSELRVYAVRKYEQ